MATIWISRFNRLLCVLTKGPPSASHSFLLSLSFYSFLFAVSVREPQLRPKTPTTLPHCVAYSKAHKQNYSCDIQTA